MSSQSLALVLNFIWNLPSGWLQKGVGSFSLLTSHPVSLHDDSLLA
jgi:hypothetical protein